MRRLTPRSTLPTLPLAQSVLGQIQEARGDFEEAAKLYMSVAVILDDEEVSPRALELAVKVGAIKLNKRRICSISFRNICAPSSRTFRPAEIALN